MADKIKVSNLYKIFGDMPEWALALFENGKSKSEIFSEFCLIMGVCGATFRVAEGEVFVVMGLSGSGKSTLVRMLNGLIKPTAGEILIDGVDVAGADAEGLRQIRLNKVAMVFQHFALFPHKTVLDNVAYGLKVKGMPANQRRERALQSLEQVGLAAYADRHPDQLSGGMRQRVGLARGLAVDPDVLLMDEPFGALDPLIRRDMQAELLELQRNLKKTIVFITHDLHEALILGDRIAIMREGEFVQVGTAREIVGAPADDYVAAFTQDIDRSRVFSVDSVAVPPEAVSLTGDTAAAALARMEALGRDALYVLDGRTVAGVVTYRDLCVSARDNGGGLPAALIARYPSIRRGAPLNELYGLAGAGLPIAVLDPDAALVGVIEPAAIFAQLAGAEIGPQPEAGR